MLTGAKAIIRATSLFVMGFIGLLAEGAITSEDDANSEGGDLTSGYPLQTGNGCRQHRVSENCL
ncbi:MAG TPA: hypothetical protein EYP51_03330 [Thiotrichales bacterium]|nr:hypothetical protein [Thiotrichales bacterium]